MKRLVAMAAVVAAGLAASRVVSKYRTRRASKHAGKILRGTTLMSADRDTTKEANEPVAALALDSDVQDQDGDGLDTLDEVSLESFTAQPTNIGPFGASVLTWSVTGPSGGFNVKLNSQTVPKTSTQVVHPTSNALFRLSAHARQASKPLGSVTVTVDRTSCVTYDIANPQSAIRAPLRRGISQSDDLYFRSDPGLSVTFSPGRILIKLRLKKEVNNFPNPDVDIDTSFGLAVNNGVLEPIAEQISVDISFPWWAWLAPGAPIALAIAIDMGKDSARKKMHETIQDVVQLLAFFGTPPAGKRLSTVRVDDGNNGAGVIEFTACSQDLLVKLADLSQSHSEVAL